MSYASRTADAQHVFVANAVMGLTSTLLSPFASLEKGTKGKHACGGGIGVGGGGDSAVENCAM